MGELTRKQYSLLCVLNSSGERNTSVSRMGRECYKTWRSISLVLQLFLDRGFIDISTGRDNKQMKVVVTQDGKDYIKDNFDRIHKKNT